MEPLGEAQYTGRADVDTVTGSSTLTSSALRAGSGEEAYGSGTDAPAAVETEYRREAE